MKFYEKERSGYEELISYYPRFYKDVDEMNALLQYFGWVCDEMEAQNEQAYLNNFIMEADADTIKRWEEMLGIIYEEPLSLEQRRRVVLGRVSGSGHIGEPEIRIVVSAYTDAPLTVDFAKGIITVIIRGDIFSLQSLYETLLRRIPAHLRIALEVALTENARAYSFAVPLTTSLIDGAVAIRY